MGRKTHWLTAQRNSDSVADRWTGSDVPGATSGWLCLNWAYKSGSGFLELLVEDTPSFSVHLSGYQECIA